MNRSCAFFHSDTPWKHEHKHIHAHTHTFGNCLCLVSLSAVICPSLSPRFLVLSSVKQPSVAVCCVSSGYVSGLGACEWLFCCGCFCFCVFFLSWSLYLCCFLRVGGRGWLARALGSLLLARYRRSVAFGCPCLLVHRLGGGAYMFVLCLASYLKEYTRFFFKGGGGVWMKCSSVKEWEHSVDIKSIPVTSVDLKSGCICVWVQAAATHLQWLLWKQQRHWYFLCIFMHQNCTETSHSRDDKRRRAPSSL